VEIQCPTGGTNVLVRGQGSGSGGAGTICARGVVTEGLGTGLAVVIRVRVVAGEVTPPPPAAEPAEPGDVDVYPKGQDWLARDVPVPSSSSTGVPSTLIAWVKAGADPWSPPTSVWFNAGGPDPVDCCPAGDPGPIGAAFAAWPPPPPPLPPGLAGGSG